ncbi:MAG: M48 family metalloprotease [Bacteroidia bacterium]|nr:M48 family metalloprotease [Bacteroidia bacterium]
MKLKIKHLVIVGFAAGLVFLQSCKDEDGNINIFSIQDDIALGAQVSAELESDPTFKNSIIDSAQRPDIYKYVYGLRDSILNTGLVRYKNEFQWRIRVIKDDSTLNAFCTPGGYIYVYTALIKFLESEDQLAGVMGHEMAHADKRHSTDAMTRQYGLQVLFDIVFGQDKGQLVRIAANIKELSYSRKNESEADEYSVIWLYPTSYNAKGAAGFFEKLIQLGQTGGNPEFLSTHPNPDNRVQAITDKWQTLGGKTGNTYQSRYTTFKNSLP